MKAVDILRRVDRLEHRVGIDLRRQGELDKNAMHGGIGVERGDSAQHFFMGGGRRQAM